MKNSHIAHKLEKFVLPFVSKPGRYIGKEKNSVIKDPLTTGIRFAIAYPDMYEIGMSSQAVSMLYHLLNQIQSVWAERVFAPWQDMEDQLRKHKIPLYTLESFTPLHQFDIIGFTLQYELTYTTVLNMLDLAHIPIFSSERQNRDPLIIGGGPGTCNPEPVAGFFDAFFIGDAEESLTLICSVVQEGKKHAKNRHEILRDLSQIEGIYIPSFYSPEYDTEGNFISLQPTDPVAPVSIRSRIVQELKTEHLPVKPVIPMIEVTHNRLAIEIMRGCTAGCRYCNAGMIYRPVRERESDEITRYTEQALSSTGYDEISLLSLSSSDYSQLPQLMRSENELLAGKRVNVSLPSLRLDSFNDEIAAFAANVRKSGFTFAPETGTERLRKVANKNISDDDLLRSVVIALKHGWRSLKFYFMIGLPTETEEDIQGIVDLMKRVVEVTRAYGFIKLNVSISPFSPKAHTPFQWERQNTTEEFWNKVNLLRQSFTKMKQVRFSWRDPAVSELECILGRGDRKLTPVIHEAWRNGSKFDGWNDLFQANIWEKAFAKLHLEPKSYTSEIPENRSLPWAHIDKGVSRRFLRKERHKAFTATESPDCRTGTCIACGLQRWEIECTQIEDNPAPRLSKLPGKDKTSENVVFQKFRVHFAKSGYARYFSHLDVLRIFERAARRSGIILEYTSGFNPRPKFSFGPALPLGFTSEAEYFDVHAFCSNAEELTAKLNHELPEGFFVYGSKIIRSKVSSLMSVINAADYTVPLESQPFDSEFLDAFMEQEKIPLQRKIRDRELVIDMRPYIESMNTSNGSLYIRNRTIDNRSIRPDEILRELFKNSDIDPTPLPIHRRAQYIITGDSILTPLDII